MSTAPLKCEEFTMSNGKKIPAIGLGTWQAAPGEVGNAVKAAIDVGYRHFDCAYIYKNEKEIGEAIREKIDEGVVKREDLFITSKCWNTNHETEKVLEACQNTLSDFGLDYVDLYLVHWPFSFKAGETDPKKMITDVDYLDTWKGMEQCYEKGWAKSIGLSNFNSEQIERVLGAAKVKPVMNQVESNPYIAQTKLFNFCKERGIMLTAYCPLGGAPGAQDRPVVLKDPEVKKIADKYGVTVAQVLVRFQLDRGIVVIPKSVSPERLKQNFDVYGFKLTPEDIKTLESLDIGFRTCAFADYKDHKNYPFNLPF